MIYILSGASRSGKTSAAGKITEQFGIPSFSIDYLIGALLSYDKQLNLDNGHVFGQPRQPFVHKAEVLWPATKGLVRIIDLHKRDYLIEGDTILPKQLHTIRDIYQFKAVFFGYPDITVEQKCHELRTIKTDELDWPNRFGDSELRNIVKDRIRFSWYIKAECAKYDFEFINTSSDFMNGVNRAVEMVGEDINTY